MVSHRMLKILWVDKVSKEEVLNMIGEEKRCLMRHKGLFAAIIEDAMQRENSRGNSRSEYIVLIVLVVLLKRLAINLQV